MEITQNKYLLETMKRMSLKLIQTHFNNITKNLQVLLTPQDFEYAYRYHPERYIFSEMYYPDFLSDVLKLIKYKMLQGEIIDNKVIIVFAEDDISHRVRFLRDEISDEVKVQPEYFSDLWDKLENSI